MEEKFKHFFLSLIDLGPQIIQLYCAALDKEMKKEKIFIGSAPVFVVFVG